MIQRSHILLLILALGSFEAPPSAAQAGPSPREIMDKVALTRKLDGSEAVVTMSVLSPEGQTRERKITMATKLYDGGKTANRVESVEESYGVGIGKAAPGAQYPTVFLSGQVDGTKGVFRSTDEGRHWVRVSDNDHQYGTVNVVEGDPRVFGRVYLGPNGRGMSQLTRGRRDRLCTLRPGARAGVARGNTRPCG